MPNDATAQAPIDPERSRLIDHFKRAYQIIVGLAITLACGKVFARGTVELSDPALYLFGTFFITVVPIFHGGDRSLDIKYLRARPTKFWDRFAYIWDVYMLLLTAILFVKVAQAIPGPGLSFVEATGSSDHFYEWMAGLLFFDSAVLVIDSLKSSFLNNRGWAHWRAYSIWIGSNIALGIVCLGVPLMGWSSEFVGILVFGGAIIRTLVDYISSSKFMFP